MTIGTVHNYHEGVYTLYSKEGDITFIMEDKDNATSVVGFYYGEPNEEYTRTFYGKLTAKFV